MRERLLIRVYGDSLSQPREEAGIQYYQTYPELIRAELAQHYHNVHLYNRSKNGTPIRRIHEELFGPDEDYFGRQPEDVLIVQLGVVDCAPRPLSEGMRNFVSGLPKLLRVPLIHLIHRHRSAIQNFGPTRRFTSPETYRRIYREWLTGAAPRHARIYCINTAPTIAAIERHSRGFMASIELYNQILAEVVHEVGAPNVHLIDAHRLLLQQGVERCVNQQDGHHITHEGHRLYSQAILEIEKGCYVHA